MNKTEINEILKTLDFCRAPKFGNGLILFCGSKNEYTVTDAANVSQDKQFRNVLAELSQLERIEMKGFPESYRFLKISENRNRINYILIAKSDRHKTFSCGYETTLMVQCTYGDIDKKTGNIIYK